MVSNYEAEIITRFVDEVLAAPGERRAHARIPSPSAMIAKVLAERYL